MGVSRGEKGKEKGESKQGKNSNGNSKRNARIGLKKKVIQLVNNRRETIIVYSKKMEETKINIAKETKEKGDEKYLRRGF